MNRGGILGRGNLRQPLMQNVIGRGRGIKIIDIKINTLLNTFIFIFFMFIYTSDNWIDNSGGRGGRDSDNWNSRGSGRDMDKWGGRGNGRESDVWGGRGNRPSPWIGNSNRQRNDDWEESNQKRWRRDDNPEWDEQQKPWKRGTINEEEKWQNNKQWPTGKKDEGHFSKYKHRDNNEERLRKPSKWGDKEPDKVKEDSWDRKSVDPSLSKDESKLEVPHQTSAPMDLDNYEGDCIDNIEQLNDIQKQEISNLKAEFRQEENFEKEHNDEIQQNHSLSSFNEETYQDKCKDVIKLNNDLQFNSEQQYENNENDFSNNSQTSHENIGKIQHDSERQPLENFEEQQHRREEKHNDYPKNTFNDFNSQHDSRENDNNTYDYERSNYNESLGDVSSHNSNNQEQHLTSNFVTQSDKIIEEKSLESNENVHFGTDCESSINNKSIEIEQQMSENVVVEGTKLDLPENNESYEVNTAELN